MSYFFYYQDDLPTDVGFGYFGPEHIIWLVIIIAISSAFAAVLHNSDKNRSKRYSQILGWTIAVIYVIRELFIACTGHMSIYELPFHLCIITGYLCLAHALTGNRIIGHFLYAGGLPGTVFALLTPDWTVYPAFSFISITNFLYHGLIVTYVIGQLASGRFEISLKKTWQVFLLVCAIAAPVYVFDSIFKVNYMFLMIPSPGSVLCFISDIFGDKLYLLGFAIFNMLVLLLMDGIYTVIHKIRQTVK